VLVAAGLAPVPLLLRRAGTAWTVPALAPLLGAASLAGAFPALAGGAGTWWRRAALGALGAWWALLAEPLIGRALLDGGGRGEVGGWLAADAARGAGTAGGGHLGPLAQGPAGDAVDHVLSPLLSSGVLTYALIWAAAAAVMPWLVRGRWLTLDVMGAAAWATALGAATAAVAQSLPAPAPRGLIAGAVVAGMVAPALMRVRDRPALEP
jgi:hypothetical protein